MIIKQTTKTMSPVLVTMLHIGLKQREAQLMQALSQVSGVEVLKGNKKVPLTTFIPQARKMTGTGPYDTIPPCNGDCLPPLAPVPPLGLPWEVNQK